MGGNSAFERLCTIFHVRKYMTVVYHMMVIFLMLFVAGNTQAQIQSQKPVGTGGNPVGLWKAQNAPIQVYAHPDLVALASDVKIAGSINGTMWIDERGIYRSNCAIALKTSFSVSVFGLAMPLSFDVADSNKSEGAYAVKDSVLILRPSQWTTPYNTFVFSEKKNTLQLAWEVPVGTYQTLMSGLAPNADAPVLIFEFSR